MFARVKKEECHSSLEQREITTQYQCLVLDTNIIHVLIYKNFSMLHSNQNHVRCAES